MKGDMYITRSKDQEIADIGECGGTVSSLLKFALDGKRVDAVLAAQARDGNRYDGVPVLITEPNEINEVAGTLHCASPNMARFIKEYLDGVSQLKVVVVVKPCDAKAIIELAKRNQINLDNLLLIGLNCTGTLPPEKAKRMLGDEFKVYPADVIAEDIDDNKLIIRLKDGTEKEKDLAELEERGYGRRENCRRCETNIPVMADIACGKWGAIDKNTTFVEVLSENGGEFIKAAIEAGYIEAEEASDNARETRKNKDEAAIKLAQQWQERDFARFREMSSDERFDFWFSQFNQCIKCYGCRDACPICYCNDCFLEAHRGFVAPGEIPPDVMFPMVRAAHVMDSCINCGQCQDACPMNIPLALLTFMLNKELSSIFNYSAGMKVDELPPLRTVTDQELSLSEVEVSF